MIHSLVKKVRKRYGKTIDFDQEKITKAIYGSLVDAGKPDRNLAKQISDQVVTVLNKKYKRQIPGVEDIQDAVVDVLMRKHKRTAQEYINFRKKRANIREKKKVLFGVYDDLKLELNATKVLAKRYLVRDNSGIIIETPKEMFRRVAKIIAAQDSKYKVGKKQRAANEEKFYEMMSSLSFLPNSPTLMNAGTRLGGLSACFVLPVEDSLEGIFDTLKYAALIHHEGGGCIAKGSYVFTTFCGMEKFDVLYKKIKELGLPEENKRDHTIIDVRSLHIQTFAFDQATSSFCPSPITHLWKFRVPKDKQVRVQCKGGTHITTSEWHPFIVFDGHVLREKRADNLKVGDILVAPNFSIRETWPFQKYQVHDGTEINEDISWLIGYFYGDGSLGYAKVPNTASEKKLRWRLFDGRIDCLLKAKQILKLQFGIKIKIQKDSRGLFSLTTTDRQFISKFIDLTGLQPIPKEKQDLLIPELIFKSPINVIAAFIGGLIDSDGYVEKKPRVTVSSQNKLLADGLRQLCALIGLAPGMRARTPYGKGKHIIYEVRVASQHNIDQLKKLILPYLSDEFKIRRFSEHEQKKQKASHDSLRLPIEALSDLLLAAGVRLKGRAIHKSAVNIGNKRFWLHRWRWGKGISNDKLLSLIEELIKVLPTNYHPRLTMLKRVLEGHLLVSAISKASKTEEFYDFTVEKHNNYLAGVGGFTVIHNTGFAFSRLRPRGDVVRSTMSVASGPVSFMKVYDSMTNTVKQGGRRRGANMGILRCDHPDIEEFITSKSNNAISNFNISVAATSKFMKAVRANRNYDLINPRTGKIVRKEKARKIFKLIVDNAWNTGDPGLFFIDEANRKNPVRKIGLYESTNPCGEIALLPYESCNL